MEVKVKYTFLFFKCNCSCIVVLLNTQVEITLAQTIKHNFTIWSSIYNVMNASTKCIYMYNKKVMSICVSITVFLVRCF